MRTKLDAVRADLAEQNRNSRRDKASWKRKVGMRVNSSARKLAEMLINKRTKNDTK